MENSKKQIAFGVYVAINNKKIVNISFSRLDGQKENPELLRALQEGHQRVGTIHATDLYAQVYKGFASKDSPDGKQYNVAEKGKWIPFEDGSLKRFQMVMRVNSNDFDIARDGQGRPIMDQEMKKPLVVVKERISYAGLIDAGNKNAVEDAIKTNMKMPACIYSTDPNLFFTFYQNSDKKLFIRPDSLKKASGGTKEEETAEVVAPEVEEVVMPHAPVEAAINDNLPF